MRMAAVPKAMPPDASVAITENADTPGAGGFPETMPDGANQRPVGAPPLSIDQVYGGLPPVALSVCEYGAPAVPSASEGAGMETGAGRMVSE